jgi:hypothetical protein
MLAAAAAAAGDPTRKLFPERDGKRREVGPERAGGRAGRQAGERAGGCALIFLSLLAHVRDVHDALGLIWNARPVGL